MATHPVHRSCDLPWPHPNRPAMVGFNQKNNGSDIEKIVDRCSFQAPPISGLKEALGTSRKKQNAPWRSTSAV